jgi:hypothetical protein
MSFRPVCTLQENLMSRVTLRVKREAGTDTVHWRSSTLTVR